MRHPDLATRSPGISETPTTRRAFLRRVLVLGSVTLAAAAAPSGAAALAKPVSSVASRDGDQPLLALWWSAPTILNPHLAGSSADYDAARIVLEPLATYDPDGNLMPVLAAEIPTLDNGGVSKDLTSVTWKLRPNVKWSDGTDLTADDVVFTYQYISDKATAATSAFAADGVSNVEAPDPSTIVVTFTNPTVDPYVLFSSYRGVILQKSQFAPYTGAGAKDAPGNLDPIGTGPYMVADFKPGDVVTYVPNPMYRDPNKPFFTQVQLKGGGDAVSAARAVLQTGQADYAFALSAPWQVLGPMAKQSTRGELVAAISPTIEILFFNSADPNTEVDGARSEPSTQHPYFSDSRVRQAFCMAIDRAGIATQLWGDTAALTKNVINFPTAWASPNTDSMEHTHYDIARANELLDEAGWTRGADGIRQKGGTRLKVLFQAPTADLRQKEQAIVKNGWQQIGADVELKAVDGGSFFSTDAGNPNTAAHFYADVEMHGQGASSPDLADMLPFWYSKEISQKANSWRRLNEGRYSNPKFDELYDKAKLEIDPAKRRDLMIQMNDIIIGDAYYVPLVNRKFPVGAKSKALNGVAVGAFDSDWWNIADWTRTS